MLQIHLDILVFILLDFSAAFNMVGRIVLSKGGCNNATCPCLILFCNHAIPLWMIESASLAFGSGCAWVLV